MCGAGITKAKKYCAPCYSIRLSEAIERWRKRVLEQKNAAKITTQKEGDKE